MQNKLVLIGIISIFALAGCATDGPVINTVIQKVEVPISVPCKAEIPATPVYSFDQLSTEQDIFEKTRAVLADRHLHMGYETELLAALNSCK